MNIFVSAGLVLSSMVLIAYGSYRAGCVHTANLGMKQFIAAVKRALLYMDTTKEINDSLIMLILFAFHEVNIELQTKSKLPLNKELLDICRPKKT